MPTPEELQEMHETTERFTRWLDIGKKLGVAICMNHKDMLDIGEVQMFKRTDDGKTVFILHIDVPQGPVAQSAVAAVS